MVPKNKSGSIGSRLGIFLFFDPDGVVSDYVLVSLAAFRPFFKRLIVVVNGKVAAEGKIKLETICDKVWVRENTDFDVGGYKYAIQRIGAVSIRKYAELVLFNYTFYAPVKPLAPLFETMEGSSADFWGITDYRDANYNFLQSYFIAIRSSILKSDAFFEYWDKMPPINSIDDSITHHERALPRPSPTSGSLGQ